MHINNAFASLPVSDILSAQSWYERLFRRPPDHSPMPTLREWQFPHGGAVQVYALPERAGGGSCTLSVADLVEVGKHLSAIGIDPGNLIQGGKAKVLMVKDPDGNSIAFAQAESDDLSR